MTSTLEKITAQDEADRLRARIVQAAGRLRELEGEPADPATARKLVLALDAVQPAIAVHRALPDNPVYQHTLAALGDAGTPLRARGLCLVLDLGTGAKHIQAMRDKLKRLIGDGLVVQSEPGLFTLHRRRSSHTGADQPV